MILCPLIGLALGAELAIPADIVPHRDLAPSSQLHAEVRPLGFSEDGKLAVLYIAPDEAVGCYQWSVSVISLVTDKTIEAIRWNDETCDLIVDVETLWKHEVSDIEALLSKHGIQPRADLKLQSLPLAHGSDLLDARLVTGSPELLETDGLRGARVPVTVRVKSTERGEKTIGVLAVESRYEMPLTWGHEVLGYVASPHEARAVVLVREIHRGWEGLPTVEVVHLMGADLEGGFPQR